MRVHYTAVIFNQGFREHLPRVPRLVKKNKNRPNLACEITSEQAIEVLRTE